MGITRRSILGAAAFPAVACAEAMPNTGALRPVDMSNGTIEGVPLLKIPLLNRPSVTEMVFNGVATTPKSTSGAQATSGYSGTQLPGTVRRIQASWKFPPGGPNSSVTLISNPNGVADVSNITTRSIHPVITPFGFQPAYWNGGAYVNPGANHFAWAAPLAQDGVTIHSAVVDFFQDSIHVLGPDGVHRDVSLPGIGQFGGVFPIFQAYAYQQTDNPPIFTGVAFEW
jgi:hypothetical protein